MRSLLASTLGLLSLSAFLACSSTSTTPAGGGAGTSADAARFSALAHRSPETCTPTPSVGAVADAGACNHVHDCTTDTDCTAKPGGRCVDVNVGPVADCGTYCMYDTCASDSDCSSDEACVCHDAGDCIDGPGHVPLCGRGNACVKTGCRSDADCPSGACTSATNDCGAFVGYECRSTQDECVSDADCGQNKVCGYDGTRWSCQQTAGCP